MVIPSMRTVVEINGMNHFYPYTRQMNNITKLKTKMLSRNGDLGDHRPDLKDYLILNLNTFILEGWKTNPR